jgi:multidrug efflux pump subunit AcrA (membrane-fusion protein)
MDLISKESGYCQEVAGDVGEVLGEQGIFARLETTYIDLQIQENTIRQQQLETRIVFLANEVKRYRNLFRTQNIDEVTLDRFEHDLAQARHELNIEQTKGEYLREQRADHFIRSHSGWKIMARDVEPGEWVRSGEMIGRAGDYRTMLVPFALSPEELRALRAHRDSISLLFPQSEGQYTKIKAKIEIISPSFDPTTRKTHVDLEVASGQLEQRGGQRAVLSLQLPDPSGAVLVPESALIASYGEYLLVRENGERVPVILLGQGPQGALRVKSKNISPGDTFTFPPSTSP